MNICIDLDDVICETYTVLLKNAVEFHKYELKRGDVSMPLNIKEARGDYYWFAKILAWSEEDLVYFFQKRYPFFLKECKPRKSSIEFLKRVTKSKENKLVILSSREKRSNEDVWRITYEWLNSYDIPFDLLKVGYKLKKNFLLQNKFDLFIDDNIRHCVDAYEVGIKYVFNYRNLYNSIIGNEALPIGVKRISDLMEIYSYINI